MSKSVVYKITNLINNEIYIGSTNNFTKRKCNHIFLLKNNRHPNKHLQFSFNKYEKINFIFSIVEEVEISKLINREQYYIDNLKPYYNISKIAGRTIGLICKESTKEKIGKANKIKYLQGFTKEHKEKLSNSHNHIARHQKQVFQYNKSELIKTWKSASEAAKYFNLNRCAISKLARRSKEITSSKSKLKGFTFSFEQLSINK